MGHLVAPELISIGRRGPELRNTWQRRSSTQQGDESQGNGTCGCIGAHLDRKMMSRAIGHVKVPKLTSIERRDPKLHGPHAAPYLNLNLVYKITDI
jgi:hypothetical protein